MKIGINVMGYPGDRNPIDNAVEAEAEGFESIWMTDGNGRMDALTAAAAIGARTTRVRIGLGIVPVFNRPPAVLAASAVALSHIPAVMRGHRAPRPRPEAPFQLLAQSPRVGKGRPRFSRRVEPA